MLHSRVHRQDGQTTNTSGARHRPEKYLLRWAPPARACRPLPCVSRLSACGIRPLPRVLRHSAHGCGPQAATWMAWATPLLNTLHSRCTDRKTNQLKRQEMMSQLRCSAEMAPIITDSVPIPNLYWTFRKTNQLKRQEMMSQLRCSAEMAPIITDSVPIPNLYWTFHRDVNILHGRLKPNTLHLAAPGPRASVSIARPKPTKRQLARKHVCSVGAATHCKRRLPLRFS
mmetsp:Transcript_56008/g.122720  ORF Transcript_56008/g.122720 Transcript_56008/m.122720 type:complete len:228 (-) Transcript_56008:126-809(-)